MAKELADDWWNQNKNMITGYKHYQFRDNIKDKKGRTREQLDVLKYEMEPVKNITYYERD